MAPGELIKDVVTQLARRQAPGAAPVTEADIQTCPGPYQHRAQEHRPATVLVSADVDDVDMDLSELFNDYPPELAWQERAACGEPEHVERMVKVMSGPRWPGWRRREDREAIAICRQCPVISECGAYADENDERFGIWGGRCRG